MAEAEDKDAVVVTNETAEKYCLTTIGDLEDVAGDLTLGGPPEWKTRQTGVPGLKAKYGVVFGDFRELDAGGPLTLEALLNDQVDAGNIFSTDPNIAADELVALEDPESLFAAQNVVPLVRAEASDADVEEALNAVSAALSQQALLDLVDPSSPTRRTPRTSPRSSSRPTTWTDVSDNDCCQAVGSLGNVHTGIPGSSMSEHVTYCRICEPLCGLIATVEDGRLAAAAARPGPAAVARAGVPQGHRVHRDPERPRPGAAPAAAQRRG